LKCLTLEETSMDKQLIKLIEYQVRKGISEKAICEQIGITPATLINMKKGRNTHEYTRQQINKFIKNGIQGNSSSTED